MKKRIILTTAAILVYFNCISYAQNELPSEYNNPQELVSFYSDIDLATALDLLSEYAIQYTQKPIYDPQKHSGPIGIDIRSLPWRKALGLILSRKGLWYLEKPRFFEIVAASQAEASITGQPAVQLDNNIELKPGSREIKIETIFFEGDRNLLTEVGVDWSTFYRGTVGIDANQIGTLDLKNQMFTLKSSLGRSLIGVDVDVLIQAFDSKKIGKVLAQPQVVVTEAKEGDIQVGQDFSIKERDFAGNIIDRFYSTGTILKVTPFVFENTQQEDNQKQPIIFLKIHVERSTAHPDVVSTIINKSQANSFIQLFDGEETIIAGLYSTEKNKIRKGIPILKDLPWWFLGFPYLFGYNSLEQTEKELIIIIKATLLKNVFERSKVANADVMSLKNSIVENHDLKLKEFEAPANQMITQSKDQVQASNTVLLNASSTSTAMPSSISSTDNITANQPKSIAKINNEVQTFNFQFGKILKLKNQLALIEWLKTCDPAMLAGRNYPVVRKDDVNHRMEFIGIVQILETRNNVSVAKKVNNTKQFQAGDYLVVRN